MYIKFFVEAVEEKEAVKLVEASLLDIIDIIKEKRKKEVIQYWKMKNIFIVIYYVELKNNALRIFMENYSDSWLEFGLPVDEFLASRNNEECQYMKKRFIMINIYLNELYDNA